MLDDAMESSASLRRHMPAARRLGLGHLDYFLKYPPCPGRDSGVGTRSHLALFPFLPLYGAYRKVFTFTVCAYILAQTTVLRLTFLERFSQPRAMRVA